MPLLRLQVSKRVGDVSRRDRSSLVPGAELPLERQQRDRVGGFRTVALRTHQEGMTTQGRPKKSAPIGALAFDARSSLPRSLMHSWELAAQGQLTEGDPGEHELAVDAARTTGEHAAVAQSNR